LGSERSYRSAISHLSRKNHVNKPSTSPFINRMRRRKKLLSVLAIAGLVIVLLAASILYVHYLRRPSTIVPGRATLHLKLDAHRSGVWSVGFSPKDDILASAGIDGTAKLWQVSDGKTIRELKHPMGVTALAFSRDGERLATTSYDSLIRLWRVADGQLLKTLSGHDKTIWFVDFSPDGKTLASSGEDAIIRLWDLNTGNVKQTFAGHSLNVWSVTFSPDGAKLASSSFDKTIKIWDLATGHQLHTLSAHTQAVLKVDFSPNGKTLVSCGDDSTVRLWDTSDWKLTRTLTDDLEHVYACKFSPDGTQLLSGGRDRSTFGELLQNVLGETERNKGVTIRLWSVADGKVIQSFAENADDVYSVAFSPDGKQIAGGGADGRVCVWNLNR
jgi:WD40 repeat protein